MSDSDATHPKNRRGKSLLLLLLRWSIAVIGIGYVVAKTPLYDSVLIVGPNNRPVKVRLAEEVPERFSSAKIIDPQTHQIRTVSRADLVNAPDTKTVYVHEVTGLQKRKLLALDLSDDARNPQVRRFLIENPGGSGEWVAPHRVQRYELGVPYPLVDQGIVPMVRKARHGYLWAAVAIFPLTFLLTGLRWHLLLRAVDIRIGAPKAFIINMVGAFFNTFMPGSTGGDLFKAYYAATLAPRHRTRAVVSVIVDRAIGLIALIILGGTMAAYLALSPHQVGDAVAARCAQVAVGAAVIIGGTIVGLIILYVPSLRRASGLDFVILRLSPKYQERASKAIGAMEEYRRRPLLVLATLLMTFPVHITVIFSAMCAGIAMRLPLSPGYYWVVVPVVVLAGAIPISPQGAGVMEFFAILLTKKQNCSISQAFALTMSIRLVQILWNLAGGIFVLRGGYHAPTEQEQEAIEADDETSPSPPPVSSAALITSAPAAPAADSAAARV